jgi:hypothetical protein
MRRRALHRRLWIFAAVALVAGCSSGTKSSKKKSRGPAASRPHALKRAKGPKTMGNMLLNSYIDDLKTGSDTSKLTAARELANMGSKAKAALPLLEPLTSHANPELSKAAKQAIQSIKR